MCQNCTTKRQNATLLRVYGFTFGAFHCVHTMTSWVQSMFPETCALYGILPGILMGGFWGKGVGNMLSKHILGWKALVLPACHFLFVFGPLRHVPHLLWQSMVPSVQPKPIEKQDKKDAKDNKKA